jgi:xanthine dehydrogenase accessory factor
MVAESGAEVLGEAALSLEAQGRIVLCQIVRTEGSTPGKVGWKMLARPDGTFCGNLGGGAFEAMVKADALAMLSVVSAAGAAGSARAAGANAAAGYTGPAGPAGSTGPAGSNGPGSTGPGSTGPAGSAGPAGLSGSTCSSGPAGSAIGGGGDGRVKRGVPLPGAAPAAPAPPAVVKRYYLTEKAARGEPTGMVCGGMAEVFLELITAVPVLVICGGGPVGQALAQAAGLAGFESLVADDREPFRRPELFPAGTRLAAVDRGYGQDFLAPVARRDLFVAVVSRCWETDVAALSGVLRQAPERLRYLGLMGSRRKVARVREELAQLGVDLSGVRLHAPIGLRLGGDSPGEIAISILAEVIGARYEHYEMPAKV